MVRVAKIFLIVVTSLVSYSAGHPQPINVYKFDTIKEVSIDYKLGLLNLRAKELKEKLEIKISKNENLAHPSNSIND